MLPDARYITVEDAARQIKVQQEPRCANGSRSARCRMWNVRASGMCCRRTWMPSTRRASAGTRRSIDRRRCKPWRSRCAPPGGGNHERCLNTCSGHAHARARGTNSTNGSRHICDPLSTPVFMEGGATPHSGQFWCKEIGFSWSLPACVSNDCAVEELYALPYEEALFGAPDKPNCTRTARSTCRMSCAETLPMRRMSRILLALVS